MTHIKFPCGCKFKLVDDKSDKVYLRHEFGDKLPRIDISLDPWNEDSIFRTSPLCSASWDVVSEGRTKGIFQLETHFARSWAKKSEPRCLEDMGALGALLRPGCIRALSGDPPKSMTQRYVDRKHGVEPTVYLHAAIEKTLQATYGVLVYQEQAMRIAEILAGFNKQEADVLRKAIGKKKADVMAKVEKEFIEKAQAKGIVTLEEAKEIFGWIRESQRYSFNKSHAVAYGLNGYWCCVIKAHFPLSFFGSWILGANWKGQGKYDEIAELLNDAKLSGITVKTPQLPSITEHTAIIDDEYVQFGLLEIKGIGKATVGKVAETLKESEVKLGKPVKDWTWIDFLLFVSPLLSKDVVTNLISVGGLDYIPGTRRNKLFEYQQFLKVSKSEVPWLQTHFPRYKWNTLVQALTSLQPVRQVKDKVWIGGGGTANKTRASIVASLIYILQNPSSSQEDSIDWIAETEQALLGTPVTYTKVDGCLEAVESNTTCKEFLDGKDGYMIFAVEVVKAEELRTKKGKTPGARMAKLVIRDGSCTIEAIVFPKEYSELATILIPGNTILVLGERLKDGGLSLKRGREIS